jgi:hypothetical protein
MATRLLTLRHDGAEVAVPIQIERPEQDSSGAWFCRYEIAWPHGRWSSAGWGFDAVQAVLLTMRKIGTEIYMSEYHNSGKLMWTAPGRGYAFPVPRNLRDLLIGDNAPEA